MTPRAVCTIDLDALAHNLGVVRDLVGPDVRICAVIKANAYGHGAVPVARALLRAGANALAVANFDEARELREAGLAVPILALSGIDPDDVADAVRLGLIPAVWDEDDLRALADSVPSGARLSVHLKIDTGMHRLGSNDARSLADAVHDLPVSVDGVFSHLACAEEPEHPSIDTQIRRFEAAIAALEAAGIHPRLRHLANSAGVLAGRRSDFDMVRPGLVLYGCLPQPAAPAAPALRPVMELTTRILHVKSVGAGEGVGYGWTFATARESRLAVLPIGYGQGYPRALSNRAAVRVRGALAPVAGTISMDHTTIDVTEIDGVRPGDPVTLWGGPDGPDVMDLGARAGTIGYELLTGVSPDVARVYKGRNE